MKILIVHSYYQLRGGEDAVFEQEARLLSTQHQVQTLAYRNRGGVRGALDFLGSIWNPSPRRRLKRTIDAFRPDIIHFHNWHFGCGPAAIRAAENSGIPVVMTLHNYRLLCPSATLYHNGSLFTASLRNRFPWQAVAEKVYRNSGLMTFWLAFIIWFHKKIGTWSGVDGYIALTPFAQKLFTAPPLQLKPGQLFVKPNFATVIPVRRVPPRAGFLYVGRLCEEKGLKVLLEAMASEGQARLRIAGDGPLRGLVEETAARSASIEYLGPLDPSAIAFEMESCSALVFPSVWYEGMPMTIVEAFSHGTPVIAGNIGAMSTLVTDRFNGLHFEAGNARDLRSKLDTWLAMTEEDRLQIHQNAYATYLGHYTPEKNLEVLENIYNTILTGKKKRRSE